jgi:hypothetical protein
MIETSVLIEILKASPYLGFILLFIWFEAGREEKRVKNAESLETRRENHEKLMQEKQLQHERDMNTLWAGYIQELVDGIEKSHQELMKRLDEHEKKSDDRYDRIGITKDLLKAAAERTKR